MYGGGGLFCPIALLTFTHYLYMYHTCMDMQTTKLEIVKKGEFGGVRSPNAFECCKNCIAADADDFEGCCFKKQRVSSRFATHIRLAE